MKSIGLTVLLAVFVLVVVLAILPARAIAASRARRAAFVAPLKIDAMLYALRSVETGHDPSVVGPDGERSAYQFTRSTWAIYTSARFENASTDPVLADMVARSHLGFIRGHLARRGLAQRPENVAAAWRCGPWFALADAASDYAQRVAALYAEAVRS